MMKISGERQGRFARALQELFTGGEVEGDSGFVRLMAIKRAYCQKELLPVLWKTMKKRIGTENDAADEIYDKLYHFFSRYFCPESGSVYFRHLPRTPPVYDRLYAGDRDIALSWRTRGLHYVKSDRIIRSMTVELPGSGYDYDFGGRFYFDASRVENKKNNERRDFVFSYGGIREVGENHQIVINVEYSERGRKTKTEDIVAAVKKEKGGYNTSEQVINRAMAIFGRQAEADYFIHGDAGGFLREQFDLWFCQFVFRGENVFTEERVEELNAMRDCAFMVIDAIAQFEDELCRIWQKPKFARNVHYVITAGKLPPEVLKKAAADKAAMAAQMAEWRELKLIDDAFIPSALADNKWKFLPLDTKHFPALESAMLSSFDDIDAALDGELWKSENWQALNTLKKRYAGRVKCIYIDPPFNLGGGDKFDYRTNYKDSSWATMLHGRLLLARQFLADDGAIFVRCDYNGNHIVRFLMDDIFGNNNFMNEIALSRGTTPQGELTKMETGYDTLHFYARNKDKCAFSAPQMKREDREWQEMHLPSERTEDYLRYRIINGKKIYPPEGRHWALSQETIDERIKAETIRINPERKYIDTEGNRKEGMPEALQSEFRRIDANWTDISGYSSTMANVVGENFPTENAEVALARVVNSASSPGGMVVDFFAGSGTTMAVAQKLGRKWLGVEMGEHFDTVILPRLKKVVAGHRSGINSNGNGNGKNGKHKCDYKGGGFFKYGALEQYEETLHNSDYADGNAVLWDAEKTALQQYVFFADEKFSRALKVIGKNKMHLNINKVCPGADLAETIANLKGKGIKNKSAKLITFADGEQLPIDPSEMDEEELTSFINLIRPCLWWGEE